MNETVKIHRTKEIKSEQRKHNDSELAFLIHKHFNQRTFHRVEHIPQEENYNKIKSFNKCYVASRIYNQCVRHLTF